MAQPPSATSLDKSSLEHSDTGFGTCICTAATSTQHKHNRSFRSIGAGRLHFFGLASTTWRLITPVKDLEDRILLGSRLNGRRDKFVGRTGNAQHEGKRVHSGALHLFKLIACWIQFVALQLLFAVLSCATSDDVRSYSLSHDLCAIACTYVYV